MEKTNYTYVTVEVLSGELDLPKSYLKELAKKGLIPCLNTGNGRLRFNPEQVEAALSELAAKGGSCHE